MATFDLLVTPRFSLIIHIALNMAVFYPGRAMLDIPVRVKVASTKWGGGSLPDQLKLAIQDDSGWEADVVLNRAKYIEPNIPVYIYSGGHQGEPEYKLAELEDDQNVAYYQSVQHGAALQVTQLEGLGHNLDFLLNGELVVNGSRRSLTPGHQAKRDDSSSDDLVYNLRELPLLSGIIDNVHLDAQPQEREQFQKHHSGMPSASSSSERLSGSLFSRFAAYRNTNLYVDVVAVADYAKYSRFVNYYGTGAQTLQAMRQYYSQVFNSVNNYYKRIKGLQNTINVRLAKLFVKQKPELDWSTDAFSDGHEIYDGDTTLNTLIDNAVNKHNPYYPYDHLMFFTGYNLMGVKDGKRSDLLGIARTSTLCGLNSLSIVEDRDQPEASLVAAHELGHALSAGHDGVHNYCTPGSHIMAEASERWHTQFSQCSVNNFNNFINHLLKNPGNCLLQQLPARSRRSGHRRHLPGQEGPHLPAQEGPHLPDIGEEDLQTQHLKFY